MFTNIHKYLQMSQIMRFVHRLVVSDIQQGSQPINDSVQVDFYIEFVYSVFDETQKCIQHNQ